MDDESELGQTRRASPDLETGAPETLTCLPACSCAACREQSFGGVAGGGAQFSGEPAADGEDAAPASTSLSDEVTFLSGLNPDGTLAFYSYAAWNEDNPATYTGGYTLSRKWFADAGAAAAGTPGGAVSYAFNSLSGWNVDEMAAFEAALALWSAVADISFTLTTDYSQAEIRFVRGNDDRAFASYATVSPTPPDAALTDGTRLLEMARATISIDTSVPGFGQIGAFSGANNIFAAYGGHPIRTLLHEIGHALGLGHGGPYNGSGASKTQQYGAYDNTQWTIMSYIRGNDPSAPFWGENPSAGTAAWGSTTTSGFIYSRGPATWMPADILAIQRIYGAAVNTPLSNVTFGYNTTIAGPVANFFDFTRNTTPIVTLWAAGAGNTLDLSGTGDATVNLNPGTFSSTHGLSNNIGIAFDTRIDRLIGSAGSTAVTGNDNGNYIDGGGGDDILSGGGGNDMLVGGDGIDTGAFVGKLLDYTISQSGSSTIISGAEGTDTLTGVERLIFSDVTVADAASIIVWKCVMPIRQPEYTDQQALEPLTPPDWVGTSYSPDPLPARAGTQVSSGMADLSGLGSSPLFGAV